MRRTTMVLAAAALAVAGSCGGGGGGRSLADLAQGTWTCAYRETPTVASGPSVAGSEMAVTARIAADSDTRGTFQLKLAAGSQDITLDGNWRLSGRDLTVAITHDSFLSEGQGNGGKLVYRGVAQDARRIEVKGGPTEPFKPVAVTHRGGTYGFRWEPFDETRAQLTCHR